MPRDTLVRERREPRPPRSPSDRDRAAFADPSRPHRTDLPVDIFAFPPLAALLDAAYGALNGLDRKSVV